MKFRQFFGSQLDHGPQYLNAAQEFALNSPKEHCDGNAKVYPYYN